MSKFWGGDSGSESESESSDDEPILNQRAPQTGGRFGANYDESDSDSEGEVRVVKSQTDRALEGIREKCHKIATCRKTNNWSLLQDEFEAANKMIETKKMVIAKTGLPKFYVKMLADVEDYVSEALKNKEALKKMKESIVRDINRMKLTVKKHNIKYESELKDYREHPENYVEEEVEEESDDDDDSDDDDEDEDESEDEEVVKPKSKSVTKVIKRSINDDDDSDDESWDEDDDEDESSESEDEKNQLKGRARWLKKVVTKPTEKKVSSTVKPKKELKKEDKFSGSAATVSSAAASSWSLENEMKEDVFNKKLSELLALRGRKGTDPRDLLMKLEVLARVSSRYGPRREIQLLMHLVSLMYDTYSRGIDDYMELNQWRACSRSLQRITKLLNLNKSIVLALTSAEDAADLIQGNLSTRKRNVEGDGNDEFTGAAYADDGKGVLKIVGSLEAHILRLHDEYNKALQQINPHTQEYVTRLSDEAVLIELADSIHQYYVRVNEFKAASIVALLHCEHMYYKHDTIANAVQRAHVFNKLWGQSSDIHPACLGKQQVVAGNKTLGDVTKAHPASFLGGPAIEVTVQDNTAKLASLCQFIFKYGDERTKTRALLFSVYHHSLHDRYHTARDLFLMSHIQDNIDKVEAGTQILYNRTLVTLGLCAFRQGLTQKAYECLAGICSGRLKELLAQGQAMRYYDRDLEQEKLERRRQMPYHMHINPDLLESCHMICAMFLELPNLARTSSTNNAVVSASHNVISKAFRKYMQAYDRQLFAGPPENTREHILAATKALLAGEWRKASDIIIGLEVWNLIPAAGGVQVKEMLMSRMKEEAVKTYLLTFGPHYESIAISHLTEMFELTNAAVKRIISKMIFSKEFSASLDQASDMVILHSVDTTALQTLTQQIADKMSILVESNERLIDPIMNVYNFNPKDDWGRRDGGDRDTRRHDHHDRSKRYAAGFKNITKGASSGGRARPGGAGGRGGYKKYSGGSGSASSGGAGSSPRGNPWGNKTQPNKTNA